MDFLAIRGLGTAWIYEVLHFPFEHLPQSTLEEIDRNINSHLLDLPESHIYELHQKTYAVDCDRVTALIVVLARDPPRYFPN